MGDHGPAYGRFVAELALQPDMIDRLLAGIPPSASATRAAPGAQVAVAAPCSIRLVAERARELAADRAEAS